MTNIESFYRPSNIMDQTETQSDSEKTDESKVKYPPGKEWQQDYVPPVKLPQEKITDPKPPTNPNRK